MSSAETARTDLELGTLFADRYKIEGVLGRGGMGAVYRARDITLGESIALKLLHAGESAAAGELFRFRQEVKLARRVTHPNVARVYDFGEHAGLAYLTMELVEGETLRQVLRREGALGVTRAARIGMALCEGLEAAHAAGIVHRDLKPANVLIAAGDRVVITDFGIARSLDEASGLTCGAIGTPSYMAPEQLVSGPIGSHTDVYALGLLLHEMLAGERLSGAPKKGLPPALDALVRACTAPLPEARPASAGAVAHALAAAAGLALPANKMAIPGVSAEIETRAQLPERDAETRHVAATPAPATSLTTLGPALAVLPFRYRGPKDQEYFGDAITDELTDVLARTRGLRVLGSGATAKFRDSRDPREVGRDLGATTIIDGSAQLTGQHVRITVRLVEAASGLQIWSERYDGELSDLMELQDTIAQRVAEELRLELTTRTLRGTAPAEAVERYLEGRHRLRAFDSHDAIAAHGCLERSVELAPDFGPAIAAHAIAGLRCWFFDIETTTVDWESIARTSVARALDRASELAETHLAAGILATHSGDYRAAARSILRALSIAPTYADAHEYLGMLQCEAGQAREGVRHLRLAISLDPTLMYASVFLARQHALHGEWAEAATTLDDLDLRLGPAIMPLARSQRVRIAGWRRDHDELRRLAEGDALKNTPNRRVVWLYARALAGDLPASSVRDGVQHVVSSTQNPRFLSLAEQLATEIFAGIGELEEAKLHLYRAATNVLVDLEWLDLCPLLAPLRALPDWNEARRRVRTRAEAVWTT